MSNKIKALKFAFFFLVIFVSGCQTAVGATKGVAYGVAGAAQGACEDTKNAYNFIMSVDDWIRTNLW